MRRRKNDAVVRSSRSSSARTGSRRTGSPGPPAPPQRPVIVGIGASAGGVHALSQLLRCLPDHTGFAIVIVQHQAPRRPSHLSAVLAQATSMPVVEAESGVSPRSNHVYVIPPGVEMALREGRLVIRAAEGRKVPGSPRSIDLFFQSLAEEEQERAIGVILSGAGSDGTDGLRAIRAAGGIGLVEDPAAARYPSMPESAIAAGAADRVLGVQELARELVELARAPALRTSSAPAREVSDVAEDALLSEIFGLVRGASGVDFSQYKSTTFRRRLGRRMLLRHTAAMADYLALLRADPDEVAALGRDILIHVTKFFRDADAFDALAREVVPSILERHSDGSPIRVWVPGCSTGEEAYSIAICLLDAIGGSPDPVPLQIFATDVSAEMIDRARAGVYADAAVRGLGADRLQRFFTRTEGGHAVGKAVRNQCVFVRHDLTRDPPFARLDLISCRNVLIYFSAALQRRVIPLFHYCLEPGGFLLLGHAEAIAGFGNLFATVNKPHKLFKKIGTSRALAGRLPVADRASDAASWQRPPLGLAAADVERQADILLLARFAPPGALIDDRHDVIHLRGQTAPFLELGPGHPNLNLLQLARPWLRPALRAALERARKGTIAVRQEGIEVRDGERAIRFALEVIPVSGSPAGDRHFLVLFDQVEPLPVARGRRSRPAARRGRQSDIQRLREETDATRAFLQSLLDERQRMFDEMAAANEELVASNEEMQSTNEELESAKEELQSANEELTTLNDELQIRNQELDQVNGDLVNILASIDIPIVIVSGDRRVRRFTPGARTFMNLIPGDVGRPLADIKLNVDVEDLDGHIAEVLETLRVKEIEVVDGSGRWHRMRIRPYRTVDDRLDGAVISLTDIDVFKQAVGDANAALDQVSAILRTVGVPLIVLDEELRVRSTNPAYHEAHGGEPAGTVGVRWFETCDGAWDIAALREALAAALAGGGAFALEVELEHPPDTARTLAVTGRVLRWGEERPIVIVTLIDITERTRLLEEAEDARAQAVRASRTKDVFLATLSHELRGPLHTIALHSDLILGSAADTPGRARGAAQSIARAAASLERIIGDLLDVSAIIAGKISLRQRAVEIATVLAAALDGIRDAAAHKRIDVRLEADPAVGVVVGDETRLVQIATNLLGNAVKFTPPDGEVRVELTSIDGCARIRVIDSGQGIAPDFLPHVFERFVQADPSSARSHGGLGLGLAIVRDLVRLHGGRVRADSDGPGTGATFTVELPLAGVRPSRRADDFEEDTDPSGHHLLSIAPKPASGSGRDLAGVRILMVDDDASSRDVICEMLALQGAEVRAVPSASQAVPALIAFRPDVLLCDIAMPDDDGFSLIRRIRTLPPEHGGLVPAVAITAMATRRDRRHALSAGFQLHVAKPASIARLCDAIVRAREVPIPPPVAGT
jgi:two-component system, chemotaxis family, CheB/CheR fusion protein